MRVVGNCSRSGQAVNVTTRSVRDGSLFVSRRDQQRAFIGITRFFPDAFVPRIGPALRPFQGCECIDGIVDRTVLESEREAVTSCVRVECNAGDWDLDGRRYVLHDSVLTQPGRAGLGPEAQYFDPTRPHSLRFGLEQHFVWGSGGSWCEPDAATVVAHRAASEEALAPKLDVLTN